MRRRPLLLALPLHQLVHLLQLRALLIRSCLVDRLLQANHQRRVRFQSRALPLQQSLSRVLWHSCALLCGMHCMFVIVFMILRIGASWCRRRPVFTRASHSSV